MAGLNNTLKKLTNGILRKKGNSEIEGSPFGAQASPFNTSGSPFAAGPPNFGDANNSPGGTPSGPSSAPPFGPPGMNANESASQAPVVDDKRVDENADKIKALENKLSKIDVAISSVQRENQDVKTTVEKMDQSVLELLSLYEIVSNQVNPFVGDEQNSTATIERFDKTEKRVSEVADFTLMLKNEIEALHQSMKMPGVSVETEAKMTDIETKMDVFADALIALQENINDISGNIKDFSERSHQMETNIIDMAQTTTIFSERIEELEKLDLSELENKLEKAFLERIQQSSNSNTSQNAGSDNWNNGNERGSEKIPLVRLESIKKNPMSVVILLNWIEFLMERVGRNNLMDALDYYVDIEWISEEVRFEIMAYARGIDYYVEKPTWRLLPEDHTKSLLFIERLCGRKIDRTMLSMTDREMAKVKHGLEELYGI
ncbi:flagella protein [Methanococcoides sp. SA1]|nr:flagella protein [Methanococcoides sp. SA1]